MKNNQIYVISMPTSHDRREHIKKQFSQQNIDFQFFDAFVPSEELNSTIETIIPNLAKTWLSPGECGCFMSHLMLWKKCIDEQIDYLFVFEDDVILSDNTLDFLGNIDWLRERFGENEAVLIKLETTLMPTDVSTTKIADYKNRQFMFLRGLHYGTGGYLISREAAQQLYSTLLQFNDDELEVMDELLFRYFLENPMFPIYQLVPAICIQVSVREETLKQYGVSFASQLEEQRKIKFQNIERANRQKESEELLAKENAPIISLSERFKRKLVYILTMGSGKRKERRLKLQEEERLYWESEKQKEMERNRIKIYGETVKENKIIEFQ